MDAITGVVDQIDVDQLVLATTDAAARQSFLTQVLCPSLLLSSCRLSQLGARPPASCVLTPSSSPRA